MPNLSGWQNIYRNNQSRLMKANDGVAFATTSKEDENSNKKVNSKGNKTKVITCYKCKQTGHYANECEEDDKTVKASNKKGSNFLVLNKDTDSSDDDDADTTISRDQYSKKRRKKT
jgi:Zinc knuckle